jgi:lipoprotein NlpI
MSGTPGSSGQPPIAAIILSVLAVLLYVFVLGNSVAVPHLESIDKGIAAIYALVGVVLLWLVLAGMVFLGASKGEMPVWAGATAFAAHPMSAAAAITSLFVLADHSDAPRWYLVFIALPPPLLAGYALWAHFPRLHLVLPATPTSAAVMGIILVMSLGQLAYTFERDRARAIQAAIDAKEADEQYRQEQEAARQANLAKFQRLTADSPLWEWQEFIGKGNELEKQAVARARAMSHRQADAEAMLRNGEAFPLYHIGELDLEATPGFCSGARDFLLKNAAEHHPESPEQRDVVMADRFDPWVPTIRWLIGQHCNLDSVVAAMQDAVRAYKSEPERDKFLAVLARLQPQWSVCSGAGKTTSDEQIAGCTAAVASGPAGSENVAIALFHRGDAYLAKNEAAPAIRDYDEAIRIKPDFAEALNNRGNALDDNGEHERAIRDYDEAIRIKPDFAQAFSNRGNTYDEMGDHGRAIQDYDRAIRLDPKYQNAFKNRGRARFFQGEFAAATADFSQALALQRTDAYAVLWLHLARGRSGAASPDDLRRDAGPLDRATWPWPVVAVYLGEQDSAAVRQAASRSGADATDQMCDAGFYLGENTMLSGDKSAARDLLQQAMKSCLPNSLEYYAAKFELERARP